MQAAVLLLPLRLGSLQLHHLGSTRCLRRACSRAPVVAALLRPMQAMDIRCLALLLAVHHQQEITTPSSCASRSRLVIARLAVPVQWAWVWAWVAWLTQYHHRRHHTEMHCRLRCRRMRLRCSEAQARQAELATQSAVIRCCRPLMQAAAVLVAVGWLHLRCREDYRLWPPRTRRCSATSVKPSEWAALVRLLQAWQLQAWRLRRRQRQQRHLHGKACQPAQPP